MKKHTRRILSAFLAFLLLCTTCIDSGSATAQAAAKKPTKIILNSKNTSMSVGDTLKLKVKMVKPAKASKKVKWTTSNKKIATVNSKGKVKAKKNGTVTIKAQSKSNPKVTAKCKIKVYKATKTLKLMSNKSYTLTVGKTQTLSAKVTKPKKGAAPVTWSSKNSRIAKVSVNGKVTAVSAGTTKITGRSGKKKVTVTIIVKNGDTPTPGTPTPGIEKPGEKEPDVSKNPGAGGGDPDTPATPEPEIITRGEWVAMLVDKLGYSIDKESLDADENGEILYEYDDITGHTYAEKIEAAYCYGVIPPVDLTDGRAHIFKPDSAVTREFAAYTIVHALGFAGEETLTSTDSDSLQYPKEDKLAVDLGMFVLKDGAFLPAAVMTMTEKEQLEALIDDILADRIIDENHKDHIVYRENVVEETLQIAEYTVAEDGTVILPYTSVTAKLKEGDILVLPETEGFQNGLVIKAASVTVDTEHETVQVTGEIPELEEVYSKIDIAGASTTLAGDIELEDGVTIVGENETKPVRKADVNVGDSFNPGLKEIYEVKIEDGTGTATASLSFEIPEIKYAFNMDFEDGCTINKFYLEAPNVITADFTAVAEVTGEKKLATLPIKLGTGFHLDVVVSVVCNAEGKLELKYTLDNSIGVQYVNEKMTLIKNMRPSFEGNLEVTVHIGADLQFQLKWIDVKEFFTGKESKPFYAIGTQMGVGAKAGTYLRESMLTCIDTNIWLYWDISIGKNSLLAELFSELEHTWGIFNENNSPLKKNIHFEKKEEEETYTQVPECTYDAEKGTLQVIVKNIAGEALEDVVVTVNTEGKVAFRGLTQQDGIYINDEVNTGTCTVSVHKTGYKTQMKEVAVEKEAVNTIDFILIEGEDEEDSIGPEDAVFVVGNYCGMDWVLYESGKLEISGEYTAAENTYDGMSWREYADAIKMAVVTATNVKSTNSWFANCTNLEQIDMSDFDTSQVISMQYMFSECRSLTGLDVSGFDTSQVRVMDFMFYHCQTLTNLDMSGFDTSQVRSMYWMFAECSSLAELDVSGFDTSQVKGTDMAYMFYNCCSLRSLDVSGFDTSQITSMERMFSDCSNLISLNVSGIDTSQVTSMKGMFSGCRSLTSLDVSGFDTSQVTGVGMQDMFSGCRSLQSLDVSGFDTSQVTFMGGMFAVCESLTSLDVSGFNTSQVWSMASMFYGCSSLTKLDLSGFDTSQVTSMADMFEECDNLTQLEVPLHVQVDCELPGVEEDFDGTDRWQDGSGNVYVYLPKNLTESITIRRTL